MDQISTQGRFLSRSTQRCTRSRMVFLYMGSSASRQKFASLYSPMAVTTPCISTSASSMT